MSARAPRRSPASGRLVPNKAEILRSLKHHIDGDLSAIIDSHRKTHAGAIHEESKAENDKDTRALESTYLARGLAQRASELGEANARLANFTVGKFDEDSTIALGALVELLDEDADDYHWYFLAPAGGGLRLQVDGEEISILTPGAPLAEALIGRELEEVCELKMPTGLRSYEISGIW